MKKNNIKTPERKTLLKKISKRIELSFKNVLYPTLNILFFNQELKEKINATKVKKVLFIRHDFVGDMVVTLPAFKYIKQINPNIVVDVFCSVNNFFLLNDNSSVDNIIIKKKQIIPKIFQLLNLKRNRYDIVFSTHGTKVTDNALITNLVSYRKTIKVMMYRMDRDKVFFNKLSKEASNQKEMWLKMLYLVYDTINTDIKPESIDISIEIPSYIKKTAIENLDKLKITDLKNVVVINLSARQSRNQWGETNYIDFIQKLILTYPKIEILLFAVGTDYSFGKKILEFAQGLEEGRDTNNKIGKVFLYPETTDIKEVAFVISCCNLVISPDTGFVHLSVSAKIPILCLYGGYGINTVAWRPYKVSYIQIEAKHDNPISSIPTEVVFSAFEDLMSQTDNPSFAKLINLEDNVKSGKGT